MVERGSIDAELGSPEQAAQLRRAGGLRLRSEYRRSLYSMGRQNLSLPPSAHLY